MEGHLFWWCGESHCSADGGISLDTRQARGPVTTRARVLERAQEGSAWPETGRGGSGGQLGGNGLATIARATKCRDDAPEG